MQICIFVTTMIVEVESDLIFELRLLQQIFVWSILILHLNFNTLYLNNLQIQTKITLFVHYIRPTLLFNLFRQRQEEGKKGEEEKEEKRETRGSKKINYAWFAANFLKDRRAKGAVRGSENSKAEPERSLVRINYTSFH